VRRRLDAQPVVESSPERRWLAACLQALARRAPVPAPPGLDWDALLEQADAEDLLPALAAAGRDHAPPPAHRRLAEALTAGRARHLVMTRALAAVLARLEADGIPTLTLKGLALAETVYPDPVLRPFADLDVLVRPEDRRRADAALLALGHRRVADAHTWEFDVEHDGATLYAGPDGVHVDLHWALVTEPRYAWSGEAATAVWERATRLTLAGRRTRGLAREDLVLYLAMHLAVHHALAGLLRHWDVALVLGAGPLDWDALLARAERWRVRRPLYVVLRGVEETFGPLVPAAVLTALAPRGPRAALLDALLCEAPAERRVRLEYLVTLLLIDRGRDVGAALRDALWPSADWLRARYGCDRAWRPALYWAHARRLGSVLAGLRN
jgi:hypothetical protein